MENRSNLNNLLQKQYGRHLKMQLQEQKYQNFSEIFTRIDSLMKLKDTVLVAIDGNSGAGKSSLAAFIGDVYDCNLFHMDDFFLRPEQRTEERFKEIGGNVDYARFKQEVITGLQSGCEFQYQVYDCKKRVLAQHISVQPKRLNIIEGVYSLHPTLVENYDFKVFLYIDEKEQRTRILKRNGAIMLNRFVNEWIPLENQYFKGMNVKEKCDLVFQV